IHSLTLGIIEAHQDLKKEIITGYKKDTNYALIFRTLREKTKVPVEIKNHIKHFCYQDDVLYYKTLESQDFFRVVIPNYKKLLWDLEDNKYSPNAEEFVRRVKLILQQTQDNIEPPRTEREMLARINELSGIGGWSEEPGKEKTYDVFWKDCDQTLARKVPERIFNQAALSLRQSLMYKPN
ncbi:hypothetical protein BOH78_4285, partial [Pichia kudriavzevii]